jgi:hypothetical protein
MFYETLSMKTIALRFYFPDLLKTFDVMQAVVVVYTRIM